MKEVKKEEKMRKMKEIKKEEKVRNMREVKKEDIELNGRDLARDLAKSTLVDTTLRKSGKNGY